MIWLVLIIFSKNYLKYIILFGIFTLPLINLRITGLLWFFFLLKINLKKNIKKEYSLTSLTDKN